jgi:hypothetical protein
LRHRPRVRHRRRVSECSIRDVEGVNLATHFVKEVQSTLRQASTSRVTKDIDSAKDVGFKDVDVQGTEFRQSDEKSMNHLKDRRKRTLAQHNLDCETG